AGHEKRIGGLLSACVEPVAPASLGLPSGCHQPPSARWGRGYSQAAATSFSPAPVSFSARSRNTLSLGVLRRRLHESPAGGAVPPRGLKGVGILSDAGPVGHALGHAPGGPTADSGRCRGLRATGGFGIGSENYHLT